MTKSNSQYKISRRLGGALWGGSKDPYNKKNYPPGQHGPTLQRKPSGYGKQLHAKQRLKGYYDIQEKQFRKIFTEASRLKGDTGENLVGLLERRLDAVIYRMHLAPTIFSAKQLVSHKHVKVNGQVVNISSYVVKEGDEIELRDKSKQIPIVLESLQKLERGIPDYLQLDAATAKGKFVRIPNLADIPYPVQMEPNLIVEFYSR